jgi:hypothetical protein
MDKKIEQKIEQAFYDEKKRAWRLGIKQSKFAVAILCIIAAVLIWNIYRSSAKVIESEKLSGVLVGSHHVLRKSSPPTNMLSIKLNSGETIIVTTPPGTPIRESADVEIIKGKTNRGPDYYYFSGYKERK